MPSFIPDLGSMPPPPTPKRPTLGIKRDSSHLDLSNGFSSSPSIPAKKLKVAFDDNVDVRVMDDWTEKSFELVKEEVRLGIQRHIAPIESRDEVQYQKVVHILSQKVDSSEAPTSKLLQKYLVALNGHVSHLKECYELVMAVLDLQWLGRDEAFVAAYTKFLRILAGAQSTYVASIMDRLVPCFEKIKDRTGRLPYQLPVSRTIMFDRLHIVIQSLIRSIPSASHIIIRKLAQHYPNDLSNNRSYLQYLNNLIRLAKSTPELDDEILALVMQRLVDIDVKIERDMEEFDEDAVYSIFQPLGNTDDVDDSDDESDSESEITMTPDEEAYQNLRLRVMKVDTIQDLLFGHYDELISQKDGPSNNHGYSQLLRLFDNIILLNRPRHAQFLLFHFSQRSEHYVQEFLYHCYGKLPSAKQIQTLNGVDRTTLNACAYMASFMARGSSVSTEMVQSFFESLCQFLEQLRTKYEPNCNGPDRRRYMLYYAVSQAVFYVFCFRWRDLVVPSDFDDEDNISADDLLAEHQDLTWLPEIQEIIHVNVHSKLNPLKICSPAIVLEFAEIAHHLRFAYVFPKLETNKRIRLEFLQYTAPVSTNQAGKSLSSAASLSLGRRETAWDRKDGEAHLQMDSYFPFDPYLLPNSKKWLDGEFNEWMTPSGMKTQEDVEESSDSEDEYSSDDEALETDIPLDHLTVIDNVSVSN